MQTEASLVPRHWKWTSVFQRKCVTNSTDSTIWQELNSQCCTFYNTTYSSVWSLHNNEQQYSSELLIRTSHYIPGTLSFLIVCIRWSVPLFVLQFHKDHRHSWIFMPAWNTLQSTSSFNGPIVIIRTFSENETFYSNTYRYTTGMRICAVCFDRCICNISI